MIGVGDAVAYKGDTHFLEIERDDDAFYAFLSQVLYLLERPAPPDPGAKCGNDVEYVRAYPSALLSAGSLSIAGDSATSQRNCDSSCEHGPGPCPVPCGMCG